MRFIIITAAYIFLLACNPAPAAREEAATAPVVANEVQLTPEQFKNGGIAVGTVTQQDMHTVLKVNGVVDVPPQNIVSVSIPMGGYLKGMQLLPGMEVKKGQVLAVMEDQQYIQLQQDYLVAASRLRFLEADYARQRELNETKTNSDKVFQQVKSEYESQQVMLRSLAEKLRLINISPERLTPQHITRSIGVPAPISGYVTKVNVNTGRYVSPTEVLFELINPADLHLSLTVFEKDVAGLAPGQKVTCYANAGEKYTATIHLITRSLDNNRAAEVHCHFEKYDKRLLPGMFMNGEIALDNAQVMAVPDDALVKWENKSFVFVAKTADTFVMTPVETGTNYNGYTEIKTNLSGKQLVTKQAYTLLMKLKNSGEE
ncbi:efflux RND transporter periplasmic adaptor subunit [Chitinophaga nivalis]|uniref:Efflux RND transporter periplasmic adaptor subunit n=1 Tax=Chitinophaga nivalis TaxID=2991709 RepID=A0ABT3IGC8_9BACT|nr:efflux RND transporter periplasmic adaptor subunit [Chitinophaga nivalis]MCW3467276.1 efflux RND transporter periplasmic adaptor subunit [Chitinophaga nivalis]MCW3483032.1 efflux RND transporter periplasmic adaptor subunit [Chitinophaga nivalis]